MAKHYVLRDPGGNVVGWGSADDLEPLPGNAEQIPAPYAPMPLKRILRDWEFRNRFTQAQLVGIMRAAMLGDDVAALVWLRLSTASDGVNLDDPDNIVGVQYVASLDPTIDPAVVLA